MTKFIIAGLVWDFHYNTTPEHIGYIPEIILASDPRPISEQIAERYAHGGGWKPFNGFKTHVGPDSRITLVYPGDPPYHMIAECVHPNGEHVMLFESAWLMVKQPDGSHAISRID